MPQAEELFRQVVRRQRTEALAENALLEYLQRLDDGELLQSSERAGRRTKFPIGETEQVIRKWRRKQERSNRA